MKELSAVIYDDDPRQAFERLDPSKFIVSDTKFLRLCDTLYQGLKAVHDSGDVPNLVNTGQYFINKGNPELAVELAKLPFPQNEDEAQEEPKEMKLPSATNLEEPIKRKFDFVPIGDLIANIKPTDWLVKPVLEAKVLAVLFGEPESYKSFQSIAWALCVATGTPWLGHEVKQGTVFAIIGEGHNGYGKRAAAWSKATGVNVEKAPFFVSTAPAAMTEIDSAMEVSHSIEKLTENHGKPELVLIDTLARNFGPGDENSTLDMNQFIANLDYCIGNDFTRLLVHHTGHGDKSRARGSSALKGAIDAEFKLAKNGDLTTLSCEKMKDSEKFDPITLKAEKVYLGGPLNDPITSLHLAKTTPPKKPVNLSPQMRQALSILDLMNQKSGLSCTSDWRDFCIEEGIYTKSAFYNAIKTMEERKIVEISDSCVKRY